MRGVEFDGLAGMLPSLGYLGVAISEADAKRWRLTGKVFDAEGRPVNCAKRMRIYAAIDGEPVSVVAMRVLVGRPICVACRTGLEILTAADGSYELELEIGEAVPTEIVTCTNCQEKTRDMRPDIEADRQARALRLASAAPAPAPAPVATSAELEAAEAEISALRAELAANAEPAPAIAEETTTP